MQVCSVCGGTVGYINNQLAKCEYCGRFFSINGDSFTETNLESAYKEALILSQNERESERQAAIKIFEALGTYKDSDIKIQECRELIAKSKAAAEDKRLADLRRAELNEIERKKWEAAEKQKRKIRYITTAIVAVVLIAVISVVAVNYIGKKNKYDNAMTLYQNGQYEEAAEAFVALGDYSDAGEYATNIERYLTERDSTYKRGVEYFEAGSYSEAINKLTEVADYLDAEEYIQKSTACIYEQAVEAYEAGEYSLAKEKIALIPENSKEYVQGNSLLAEIESILLEQQRQDSYNQALTAYENGQYDVAQNLFINLGDYQDSQLYLSYIGTSYYEQATAKYNEAKYSECFTLLESVDESKEWNDYNLAMDLKTKSVEAYAIIVYEGAVAKHKSDGANAMNEYLSSMVCNIFSQSDATDMKIDINQKYSPVPLFDCVLLEDENLRGSTVYNMSDVFKNIYDCGIEYYDPYNFSYTEMNYVETYEKYYLNKSYVHFSAIIVPYESGGESAEFTIYADNVAVFSCTIDDQTRPQEIELDISGVDELKIAFWDGYKGHFLLANPYLYKYY